MTYTPLTEYRKNLTTLRLKTRLLLSDPSGERWSDARIDEAINFACLEWAIETESIKDEVEVQLLANQWDYNVKQAAENSGSLKPYGWLVRVGYNGVESAALEPVASHVTDISGMTYSLAGTSTQFHLDLLSYGEIGILPVPGSDGETLPDDSGNIQVTYIAMPEEMDDATDYPDSAIQATYHQFLPYKAASYLLEEGDEDDMVLAIAHDSEFERGCYENIADQYQSETGLADLSPM